MDHQILRENLKPLRSTFNNRALLVSHPAGEITMWENGEYPDSGTALPVPDDKKEKKAAEPDVRVLTLLLFIYVAIQVVVSILYLPYQTMSFLLNFRGSVNMVQFLNSYFGSFSVHLFIIYNFGVGIIYLVILILYLLKVNYAPKAAICSFFVFSVLSTGYSLFNVFFLNRYIASHFRAYNDAFRAMELIRLTNGISLIIALIVLVLFILVFIKEVLMNYRRYRYYRFLIIALFTKAVVFLIGFIYSSSIMSYNRLVSYDVIYPFHRFILFILYLGNYLSLAGTVLFALFWLYRYKQARSELI